MNSFEQKIQFLKYFLKNLENKSRRKEKPASSFSAK